MRLIKVLDTIEKNIYGQGAYKNLMWMYNPDTLTLSIANKSNFDRWANSRIIDIYPVIFDKGDPRLVYVLDKLSETFDGGREIQMSKNNKDLLFFVTKILRRYNATPDEWDEFESVKQYINYLDDEFEDRP